MTARAGPPRRREARFTTGSTMRHVVVMTLTSMLGLSFMFLVDFVTLFWIGQIGDPVNVAAVGYAWTIQFFAVSSGIGLSIAAMALIARAIGMRDWRAARQHAGASLLIALVVQGAVALAVLVLRQPLLAVLGASDQALAVAGRFLLITVPTLPLMALGMVAASGLRAAGDAWRAMTVTLAAGVIALIADPLVIFPRTELLGGRLAIPFGAGLGMDGAAWVLAATRVVTAGLAIGWLAGVHDLIALPGRAALRATARPFFRIALPAIATQMSTPVGNAAVTAIIAEFGDAAMAGWSVVSRLMILAFGGIFALSGAIGGIIGQNHGAGLAGRVASAYRDAMLFSLVYVLAVWTALALAGGPVIAAFGVTGEGARVVRAFTELAAGGFVFTGALFVANATFNNLGRPLWSTAFNWTRDLLLMAPLAWAMARLLGAPGAVYGQALAGVAVGALAGIVGWRHIASLQPAAQPRTGPA